MANTAQPGGVAGDQLRTIVERVERLEEEKQTIADDIKDVFAEAKSNGFDVKALRALIRLRKQEPNERQEHEAILDVYMRAPDIKCRPCFGSRPDFRSQAGNTNGEK